MANQKLTARQKAFVDEYLVDLNATKAAIRAGYSKKTAVVIGNENLTKPYIAAEVQRAMRERSEKTKIDAEWVLREFVSLYNKAIQNEPVLDLDGSKIGEYKFDGANANRALENVAKHVSVNAYASSKHEHTGKDGGPIRSKVIEWVLEPVSANPNK